MNDHSLFANVVTENKEIPESAKIDLAIAMITLKYTQSNSVCYVKGGQAIGIGAGQQSRIHCTRLAGSKADNWFLRQNPKVLSLPFKEKIGRADRDNTIDVYMSDDYMDVLADGVWENFFTEKPEVLTREEKRAWLDKLTDVSLGSDAFFPFGDNRILILILSCVHSLVILVDDSGFVFACCNVDIADEQRYLVLCIQAVPYSISELVHIIWNIN